jgi:pilus assembly protein CpaF
VLVRHVVADYAERSLSSALPSLGDADGVVRDVLDRVAGYGSLQHWLDDPRGETRMVKRVARWVCGEPVRSCRCAYLLSAAGEN